jgi:hypothetical protein
MAVTINGTSGITDVDGSAGAPAITGTDTDTGLFFSTNILGLSTGGSERVRVDSSGNVGIGTSSPLSKLEVYDATSAVARVTAGTEIFEIRNTGSEVRLAVVSADPMTFRTSNVEAMRIDSSGNVGIGTASPTQNLSVNGYISVNSNNISADNSLGFRNRIINGDMRIDQRNAGAAITTGTNFYSVDRWNVLAQTSAKITVQQNNGSVTPPAGFSNYLGVSVGASAGVTVGATDQYVVRQLIEGFNVADLGFGTASAKTITLSFWVRSSVTGTFGGALINNAGDRSYPFTYTISSANTWEQKTVTIVGVTTGTWVTNNGNGLNVTFSIGVGSTYSGTAGSWASTYYASATGAVKLVETNSATWYVTGVQLEVGSVATPFERRDYGHELMMCQRYYEKTLNQSTTSASGQTSGALIGVAISTTNIAAQWTFKQTKRGTPTLVLSSFNGTAGSWANIANTDFAVTQPWGVGDSGFSRLDSTGMTAGAGYWGFATASSEL